MHTSLGLRYLASTMLERYTLIRRLSLCRAGFGDGPLSVRVRPSSLKHDCDRRTTNTDGKRRVNVHAKSRLTPEPLRTLRSEDKGQAGACPDRTRAIPCTVRVSPRPRLTATVTATAAANGKRQRPVTTHNARTIRANWGYVRPEKQTVEDQRRSAATVAKRR